MPDLEFWLSCWTLAGLGLGGLGILWARSGREPSRVSWGRRLFVAALVFLGLIGLIAAFHRAEGLAPLGLTAGGLVIGMLWDNSRQARVTPDSIS